MEFSLTIDSVLDLNEQTALAANLGIGSDPDKLRAAAQKLTLVALAELFDMLTGRDPEKLSSETALKRLQYLIVHYYEDHLPTEAQIARLFQITPTRAKTLLTNLHATRRTTIEAQQKETIARVLRAAKKKKDEVTVVLAISSAYVYDAIKGAIETRAAGAGLRSIGKQRDSVDAYEVGIDTFNLIAPDFGVAPL